MKYNLKKKLSKNRGKCKEIKVHITIMQNLAKKILRKRFSKLLKFGLVHNSLGA